MAMKSVKQSTIYYTVYIETLFPASLAKYDKFLEMNHFSIQPPRVPTVYLDCSVVTGRADQLRAAASRMQRVHDVVVALQADGGISIVTTSSALSDKASSSYSNLLQHRITCLFEPSRILICNHQSLALLLQNLFLRQRPLRSLSLITINIIITITYHLC